MRPQILYNLFAPIENLDGIGTKTAKLLSKLDIFKVVDLLWQMPHSIICRKFVPNLMYARPGDIITLKIKIIKHEPNKQKSKPYKVICSDGTFDIVLNFFNAYPNTIAKNLPIDAEKFVSGKIEKFNNQWQINHPDYITSDITQIPQTEPVYGLTAGISNKMMQKFIKQALALTPKLDEWLDEHFLKNNILPSFNQALIQIHNPQSIEDLSQKNAARTRLAYDELLANQLALAMLRQRQKQKDALKICGNNMLRQKVLNMLDFELTNDQQQVLNEIYFDQAQNYKMMRLLQGDVGSGKTIVAFLAMLNAVECGFQACIMAPTEILASQHFETLLPMCEELNLNLELLTGKTKNKKLIYENLAKGKINIIVGTHALFQENVAFENLGLIVIDEQHRFGVHQRLSLSNKAKKADVLVMTATPIPRTLMLTAYGDMQSSQIMQMPKGRLPVITKVMNCDKLNDVIAALKEKVSDGAQAYWVCPLVEESEKTDLAAAQQRFEMLQKTFGTNVGLIHGKMKEAEKNQIMQDFQAKKFAVLVATTVIEVGVNVKNATIMIVEHAQRFGLAQLHQLRGRVKRGIKQGTCLLLYNTPCSAEAKERLAIMKETENGFEIAEKDLQLRGGGELLGTKQSGWQNFKIADLSMHKNLLITATNDAKFILQTDTSFTSERAKNLKNLLYLFEKDESAKTFKA